MTELLILMNRLDPSMAGYADKHLFLICFYFVPFYVQFLCSLNVYHQRIFKPLKPWFQEKGKK